MRHHYSRKLKHQYYVRIYNVLRLFIWNSQDQQLLACIARHTLKKRLQFFYGKYLERNLAFINGSSSEFLYSLSHRMKHHDFLESSSALPSSPTEPLKLSLPSINLAV